MAVISPSVPIMSLFVIYRSSSLLWLRRRTCYSASVHHSPVPLESLQDRLQTWNPPRKPLSRSQRYMPHVSASRPNSFSRCAEPPPRPPNRSRRTASCRGRSPAALVQRAGGLRCSRLHSGVCSHSPLLRSYPLPGTSGGRRNADHRGAWRGRSAGVATSVADLRQRRDSRGKAAA
jgi:hypothetical protein